MDKQPAQQPQVANKDYHTQLFSQAQIQAWFPHHSQLPPPNLQDRVFDIGLVIAGAVSGGAYAAGVMDFLIEALDAWEEAKSNPETALQVPRHRVKLKIIAGASAGSILGAQIALASHYKWHHAEQTQAQRVQNSPFYKTWVGDLDFKEIVDKNDLENLIAVGNVGVNHIRSLMSATFIRNVAGMMLDTFYQAEHLLPDDNTTAAVDLGGLHFCRARRAWLEDGFRLSFQVNNLRGISYQSAFTGLGGWPGQSEGIDPFMMRVHEDRFEFFVCGARTIDPLAVSPDIKILSHPLKIPPQDIRSLDVSRHDDNPWKLMVQTAMASSAFPFGLPLVPIERSFSDYFWRYYDITRNEAGELTWHFAIPAEDHLHWYDRIPMLLADGGSLINEPFPVALRHLAGFGGTLPHDQSTTKAILLIDPFPEMPKPGPDKPVGLLPLLLSLIESWKNNARANFEGLARDREQSYSRFLLRPKRPDNNARQVSLQLASGPLEGFFGLFDPALREHDYRLGRINCQKFLRDRFVLPLDSTLFKDDDFYTQDHSLRDRFASQVMKDHYQIIPLCGSAAQPLWDRTDQTRTLVWPDPDILQQKVLRHMPAIKDRIELLLKMGYLGIETGFREDKAWVKMGLAMTLKLTLLGHIRDSIASKVRTYLDQAVEEIRANANDHAWTVSNRKKPL